MALFPVRRLLSLLVFLVAFAYAPATASPSTSLNPSHLFHRDTTAGEPLNCTTQFSLDYYGFGVRLGVYFTWLSSYFANVFLTSEISGSLDTNSIFLLALLISIFEGSFRQTIYQIDGLILMQMSSGFVFTGLSIWGYRTAFYKKGPTGIQNFGRFGTHFRLVLTMAISVYGTWFWWEGVKDGLPVQDDKRCRKIYTWLFTNWPVNGGVNVLYIVISLGCSIYYGLMCVAAVASGVRRLLFHGPKRGTINFETGLSSTELHVLHNVFRIFNAVWIIFSAIMIEFTLIKNNVLNALAQNGGIINPSQLLPLLIGATSFLRVLWLMHEDWKESHKEEGSNVHYGPLGTPKSPANRFSFGGIFSPTMSRSNTGTAEADHLPIKRPWHHRYMVSWLPWLSTFDFWMKPRGHEAVRQEDAEGQGNQQGRQLETMSMGYNGGSGGVGKETTSTGYVGGSGLAKETNVRVTSVGDDGGSEGSSPRA